MSLPVCRVCLACDVSLHSVKDLQLGETYERLAGAKFYSVDEMSMTLCYFCYWQLRKCCNFSAQARSSHKILREAIQFGPKVGQNYIQNLPKTSHLTISTIKTLSLDGSTKRKSSIKPLKNEVKKVNSENRNGSLKPLPTEHRTTEPKIHNTQNLKSLLKNSSTSSLELLLMGNPELIIKKQKKSGELGETVQISIQKETEQNVIGKLIPNKKQSTEKNAQCDPQMVEEYLDVDYDGYDDNETLHPCHEGKEKNLTEINLAEHNKNHNNQKVYNLKQTKIGSQIFETKKEKKRWLHGFNQSGGQVFRPAKDTNPDVQNFNIVAEYLEIESDSDLRTNLILNNQNTVHLTEENVDHQDKHNNKTQIETQFENDSEKFEIETKKDSQSNKIYDTLNSAPKLHNNLVLENITNEPRIYKCNFCKNLYITKENLNEHEQVHKMSIQKYTCKECGHQFISHINLVEHIRKHSNERPYMCEICGKSFTTPRYLDMHLDVHSNPKHICKICNKSFKSRSYVYDWHMNAHFNVRPYVCHVCKKGFHQSSALWMHIRTVHQGLRRYACDICSFKFNSKSHLTRHIKTHSGVKEFSCDYCNMDFTTKSTLRRHIARYCKMK